MMFGLEMVSRSGMEAAAREVGLKLTADQVREIANAEAACLVESGRVSFGTSAAVRIVRECAPSPCLAGDDAAQALVDLVEAFYELRDCFPAATTDEELLELLRESFDGDAAGDVGLAVALTRDALVGQSDCETYEIVDDDGRTYRWDSEEWHEDVTAPGWYGERWDAHE